jgi:hypothetical protein
MQDSNAVEEMILDVVENRMDYPSLEVWFKDRIIPTGSGVG